MAAATAAVAAATTATTAATAAATGPFAQALVASAHTQWHEWMANGSKGGWQCCHSQSSFLVINNLCTTDSNFFLMES